MLRFNSKSFNLAIIMHICLIGGLCLYKTQSIKIEEVDYAIEGELWQEVPQIHNLTNINTAPHTQKIEKNTDKALPDKNISTIVVQKIQEKTTNLKIENKPKPETKIEERIKSKDDIAIKKLQKENKLITKPKLNIEDKIVKPAKVAKTEVIKPSNTDNLKKLLKQQAKQELENTTLRSQNLNNAIREANLARIIQSSNTEKLNNKNPISLNNSSEKKPKGISANYKAKIISLIQRNIKYNGENDILSIVDIRIDNNGNLIRKSLSKSSGNSKWDNSVMQAIVSSQPFPAPENGNNIGITIRLSPINSN